METLLEREAVLTRLKEISKLNELYEEMVKNYPKRYEGWWGKLIIYTKNFTSVSADKKRVDKWYAFVKECAPADVLPKLEKKYNTFVLGLMKRELDNQKADIERLNDVIKDEKTEAERNIQGAKNSRNNEIRRILLFAVGMIFCVIGTLWSKSIIDRYWETDSELVPKWAYSSLVLVIVFPIVFIVLGYFFFKTQEFSDLFTFFYISGVKKKLADAQEQYDRQYKEKSEILQQTEANINAFIQEKELTE